MEDEFKKGGAFLIKKAIIPAAGYGTRGLPITKVLPKEMFPIGVKPAIHYVVEEAVNSGIEQILMVVSRKKSMIVDYFDHSLELEAFLEKENKQHLLTDAQLPKIEIHYVRQPYAKGLGVLPCDKCGYFKLLLSHSYRRRKPWLLPFI